MMAQVLGSLPCPQEGDLDQVLGFKPQPSPALPVAGIWEMKEQMEDLCLSNKTRKINTQVNKLCQALYC